MSAVFRQATRAKFAKSGMSRTRRITSCHTWGASKRRAQKNRSVRSPCGKYPDFLNKISAVAERCSTSILIFSHDVWWTYVMSNHNMSIKIRSRSGMSPDFRHPRIADGLQPMFWWLGYIAKRLAHIHQSHWYLTCHCPKTRDLYPLYPNKHYHSLSCIMIWIPSSMTLKIPIPPRLLWQFAGQGVLVQGSRPRNPKENWWKLEDHPTDLIHHT